ncbi:MAG: hypothetical protein ACXVXP_13140 [Mycobacteriaceae bacterium]
MSHENESQDANERAEDAAPEATGTIVAGQEAHKIEDNGDQPEVDPEDAAQETTGTIVAGPKAHEIEGQGDGDQS